MLFRAQERSVSFDNPQSETLRWRAEHRKQSLQLVADRARALTWSPAILELLAEELWAGEDLTSLIGPSKELPISEYAYAVAVSLAIRHSWRRDDLRRTAKRLGISVRGL